VKLNDNCQTRVELFPAAMISQWESGGGRILLGDDSGGEPFIPQPTRFQYAADHKQVYSIPTRAGFDLRRAHRNVTTVKSASAYRKIILKLSHTLNSK